LWSVFPEEAGSPHLASVIEKYKSLLASDVWLICDGPVHQSRRQQIVFGARGVTIVETDPDAQTRMAKRE